MTPVAQRERVVMKRAGAAKIARALGHELGAWDRRAFVDGVSAQCRDCGRQVLLMRGGEIHGDAVEVACTGPREPVAAASLAAWREVWL